MAKIKICLWLFSVATYASTVASTNVTLSERGTDDNIDYPEAETKPFPRLPTNVTPVHYCTEIVPNYETFTFDGHQDIDVIVKEDTTEIVLNAVSLSVTNVRWWSNTSSVANQSAEAVEYDENQETVTFRFNPPLKAGFTGKLRMNFTGTINDNSMGLYRSKFKKADGTDGYNLVTQFEPTRARRCFPCWDEPALKATFSMWLVVPNDKVALSNMPVKQSKLVANGTRTQVEFEKSPVMSTYLVAVVIGDFEYIEANSSDGVRCRVYTPPGKTEQGRFALEAVTKMLPFFKEYFGVGYDLPKMDLVAIREFGGGMENWGLVIYSDSGLLFDEQESSQDNRRYVASLVGHETAHMWFGNLVTMKWWTDLWLKEGYATFMGYLATEHVFPELDIWSQFVRYNLINGLQLDALESSHPIEVLVRSPSEIGQIFDAISYRKGASLIRMLYEHLGDTDFKKGMNLYLMRHQFNSTVTDDLWSALEDASGQRVGEIMRTWTKQTGFPLIRVVSSRQDGNSRVIELTQEKFTHKASTANYTWKVPLLFTSSSDQNKIILKTIMETENLTVVIPNVEKDEWVKLNPGTVGFYRVLYPPKELDKFVPSIESNVMTPPNRLGMLDDMFALVKSGQRSTPDLLRFLNAFKNEDDFTAWLTIDNIVGQLSLVLQNTDYYDKFCAYGIKLYTPIHERLGWEEVSKQGRINLAPLLRGLVLSRLVFFGNNKTLEEAKSRFEMHLNGSKPIVADLRSAMYKGALSTGDETTLNKMLDLYRKTDLTQEKDRIKASLGAVREPKLIKTVLDFAFSDDVRRIDSISMLNAAGVSKLGRDLVWEFFKEKKDIFLERYPPSFGGGGVAFLTKGIVKNFASEERALEVEKYFKENPFPGTERAVTQALESIRLNAALLKRDESTIKQFLDSVFK